LKANQRLNPPIWGNIYFSQVKLRIAISSAITSVQENADNFIVVDAGCGTKPYKEIIEANNASYVGIDIDENGLADKRIFSNGTFEVDTGYANILLSSQVLEHVYDIDTYLYEANRVVKEKGHLILSTHGNWAYHPDPNDYWRWTSEGLRKTIEKFGFEIISFQGIMSISSYALQILQDRINGVLKLGFLRAVNNLFFQQIAIPLSEVLSNKEQIHKDATIFVVIAKKK